MTVSAANISGDTLNYSYDALQRLTSQTTVRTGLTLAKEYSYKNLSGNRTTTQISGYTAKVNGTAIDSYTYSYDNLGNITIVSRNNGQPIYYTYDAQNQLIEVNDGTFRYEYTYDTYGNILSVGWFDAITDDEISIDTYAYGNSQWVDRLTEFNGEEFDYDQIGNPLSYYNGYSYTFTWNGRELATATKGSTSVSYKYGADGLRTQKTVGSTVYNYYYADGLLIRQTWGTNYMDFLYDESGSPYSFIYNGTQYYYIKNLQGDVMRIVDTSGTVVANYFYDAWGKVTNSGTIIGLYNPIRYRGYYYDTDTGFYYLQSRYYDPTIKRFISADDVSYLGANGDFTSLNLYAYCGNNPVNYSDASGHMPEWAKWTVCGLAVAGLVVATVLTFGAAGAGAAAVGAAMLTGGLITGGIDAIDQYHDKGQIDFTQVAISTLSGIGYGLVAGLTGGVAGWNWGALSGKLVVSGGTSLLNSWNNNSDLQTMTNSLSLSLAITFLIHGGTYGLGKVASGISKWISKHIPKSQTQTLPPILTMGDIASYVWNIPAVKTGSIRFISKTFSSIYNDS